MKDEEFKALELRPNRHYILKYNPAFITAHCLDRFMERCAQSKITIHPLATTDLEGVQIERYNFLPDEVIDKRIAFLKEFITDQDTTYDARVEELNFIRRCLKGEVKVTGEVRKDGDKSN